eukprot:CAMPEP_0113952430 /NCGR_PEP_ID=MMETSP1339-20121228/90416_1 /TAXON_ID=94617 /ORGANISM="Fibrocapsa japonica" /LENGTH=138 /DNA_ID=CAMNT_0000961043 /DNA_START=149 /DNA_END=565 /DNA_ORIENTATION=+ /assembly_acc=CAM_ASM_000762
MGNACTKSNNQVAFGTKHCLPEEKNVTIFSEQDARKRVLIAYPNWTISYNENSKAFSLKREFVAKNFQAALDFVVTAGAIAEAEGHHPDLHITRWRNVEVEIYMHEGGGLTENDFILAGILDNIPVVYSPKWLRDSRN